MGHYLIFVNDGYAGEIYVEIIKICNALEIKNYYMKAMFFIAQWLEHQNWE